MRHRVPILSLSAAAVLLAIAAALLAPTPPTKEAGQLARPRRHHFGVDAAAMAAEAGGITLHGPDGGVTPLTQAQALDLVGAPGLPTDAGWLRLTTFGSPPQRKAVTDALASAPELAPWRSKLAVQSYGPFDWPVDGFRTDGKPTIYVQAPSGKVLHRQDDFADGAIGLAKALGRAEAVPTAPAAPTLRERDPSYDPAKDPDLRKSDPAPIPGPVPVPGPTPQPTPAPVDFSWVGKVPAWAWALLGMGVLLATIPAPRKESD